jgi:hypothetical protein
MLDGWQWLTTNADWDQSWAVGTGLLQYKRNEIRLTIRIPKTSQALCKPWLQIKFLVPEVAGILSSHGDPENWWIFNGRIKPSWILKSEAKHDEA